MFLWFTGEASTIPESRVGTMNQSFSRSSSKPRGRIEDEDENDEGDEGAVQSRELADRMSALRVTRRLRQPTRQFKRVRSGDDWLEGKQWCH